MISEEFKVNEGQTFTHQAELPISRLLTAPTNAFLRLDNRTVEWKAIREESNDLEGIDGSVRTKPFLLFMKFLNFLSVSGLHPNRDHRRLPEVDCQRSGCSGGPLQLPKWWNLLRPQPWPLSMQVWLQRGKVRG